MSGPNPVGGGDAALLRRLEALAPLLSTIRGALDIREVFGRVSDVTRTVLPHDTMGLAVLDEDGVHARLYAVSTDVDFERPEKIAINDGERKLISDRLMFEVVDDISRDPAWRNVRRRAIGLRAMIRVPVDLGDVMKGGLSVFSRQPGAFTTADVPVLQRVAEYVSLALSHQRLAEEAARAAEARERAARLEQRVQALTDELASRRRTIAPSARPRPGRPCCAGDARGAPTDTTVLLLGESGTGKEVVARFIHRDSARGRGPFVAVNCAALPEHLLESELFGYERGAFTGAHAAKPGQLEQADGGTLFLDEVGEMTPGRAGQAAARAAGAASSSGSAATRRCGRRARDRRDQPRPASRPSRAADSARTSSTASTSSRIDLPPLRERREDILLLSEAFLRISAARSAARRRESSATPAALLAHTWPGNVRELRNTLERAAILCDGGLITAAHLNLPAASPVVTPQAAASPAPGAPASSRPDAIAPSDRTAAVERRTALLKQALRGLPLQQGGGRPHARPHADAAVSPVAAVRDL